MKYKRQERRQFIRFDLDADVRYNLAGEPHSRDKMRGKAKNLSAEGVCIAVDKELPRDNDVQVDILLPGKRRPVRVDGKVVWVKKIPSSKRAKKDRFEAGIKIYTVDKDDENTLLKYYCSQMVDNLSQFMHL